jgi:RNA polymerase sigma factor (sigma-70 family)
MPHTTSHDPDQDLVDRLRNGDVTALDLLAERRSQQIRSTLRHYLSHEDTDEALQDTLMTAWMKIGLFKGNSKFYTWLTSVAIHNALTRIRSKRRKAAQMPTVSIDDCAIAAPLESEEIDIERALSGIPASCAEVARLRLWDYTVNSIASLLGLSRSAAKLRIRRAKEALRAVAEN